MAFDDMPPRGPRYAAVPLSVIDRWDLGLPALRLLLRLGRHASLYGGGWCQVSLATIAEEWGVTRQALQRPLRQLVAQGYVQRHADYRANGSNASNLYRVIFDPTDPAREDDNAPVEEIPGEAQPRDHGQADLDATSCCGEGNTLTVAPRETLSRRSRKEGEAVENAAPAETPEDDADADRERSATSEDVRGACGADARRSDEEAEAPHPAPEPAPAAPWETVRLRTALLSWGRRLDPALVLVVELERWKAHWRRLDGEGWPDGVSAETVFQGWCREAAARRERNGGPGVSAAKAAAAAAIHRASDGPPLTGTTKASLARQIEGQSKRRPVLLNILARILARLGEDAYASYLDPARAALDGNCLVLTVPGRFHARLLAMRCGHDIQSAVMAELGRGGSYRLQVQQDVAPAEGAP